MIQRKQLFLHKPEEGIYGDCHSTAIACLLHVEPEEVPHFNRDGPSADVFNQRVEDYLRARAFTQIHVAFAECSLEYMLAVMAKSSKDVYYLLGGRSRTGCNHTVIGCGGEIVWDPSTTDAGIVGPLDTGQFVATWLVPLRFRRAS